VETDIESGLRWGELTELRPRDIDLRARILTVSRVVVELTPRFHPDGGRVPRQALPKDQEHRRLKLSTEMVTLIKAHIKEHDLGDDDLLFAMPENSQSAVVRLVADPDELGLTAPNAAGRQYRHGTLSAYSAGKCKCEHCRGAYARYRRQRRAGGPGSAAPSTTRPNGRAHSALVVPASGLAARHRGSRADGADDGPRAATCPRLMASGGRSGHPGGEGAPRPFQHHDDPEVPRHPWTRPDETAIDALSKIRKSIREVGYPCLTRTA